MRELIAAWSQVAMDAIALRESPKGPVWDGRFQGSGLEFSVSYAPGEVWIGARRGGAIGIDVMRLQAVPEADAVARLYFSATDRAAFQMAADPVRDFALAWTRLEASCKYAGQGLTEGPGSGSALELAGSIQSVIIDNNLALAVAT